MTTSSQPTDLDSESSEEEPKGPTPSAEEDWQDDGALGMGEMPADAVAEANQSGPVSEFMLLASVRTIIPPVHRSPS